MKTEKVSSVDSLEPWWSRRGVAAGGGGAPMLRNGSKASDSKPAATSALPSSPHAAVADQTLSRIRNDTEGYASRDE